MTRRSLFKTLTAGAGSGQLALPEVQREIPDQGYLKTPHGNFRICKRDWVSVPDRLIEVMSWVAIPDGLIHGESMENMVLVCPCPGTPVWLFRGEWFESTVYNAQAAVFQYPLSDDDRRGLEEQTLRCLIRVMKDPPSCKPTPERIDRGGGVYWYTARKPLIRYEVVCPEMKV